VTGSECDNVLTAFRRVGKRRKDVTDWGEVFHNETFARLALLEIAKLEPFRTSLPPP
jgi:hypothetical protein